MILKSSWPDDNPDSIAIIVVAVTIIVGATIFEGGLFFLGLY
jgi:hypothetical protein